ncbi:FecR family protein [Pedobacter sp. PLR]|uniref:FecR family protein n=1 Tax=Pedobacter sp. PLR TaxID=2994465 RepID=UPI0022470B12|nr:FecR family protein [Pedobacter sp. PLR]MCX2451283.1 FecR family protein [Pedobacter sp. PLR]
MSYSRLNYLFGKYFDKTATPEERAEFMRLVARLKSDEPLVKLMEATYTSDQSTLEFTPEIKEKILNNIYQSADAEVPVHQLPKFSTGWTKYAAVLLIGILGLGLFFYKKDQNSLLALQTQDIAPGGNKAILTLGNGKKIVLDTIANGVLVKQGNISISKTADGQLVYNVVGDENEPATLNTIETPNGGQYQVNLPDGTKVWLNAGTQIKFPTRFVGKERNVELIGEAYFEVAKNAKKPFKVKMSNHTEVVVLGTHFNISAYKEENEINTTLLEGAVMVKIGQKTAEILPGQQAVLNKIDKNINLVDDVNVNQAIAWKNGFFSTEGISLPELMKQVEKWYNIRVVYKDNVQADFTARLPRNISLVELISLLELTKQVHFKLDNKTLTIMK